MTQEIKISCSLTLDTLGNLPALLPAISLPEPPSLVKRSLLTVLQTDCTLLFSLVLFPYPEFPLSPRVF